MLTAMPEPYHIRRGTPADTRPAFDVFLAAAADLFARQGMTWEADPEQIWSRLQPLLDRLATHAAEWWLAEDPADGTILGYARSVQRAGLFELTEYFVRPDRQSAGVGTALLKRAFPADRGDVRAIIATTDVRAQSRYYRAGTAARFPIASVEGKPGRTVGGWGDVDVALAGRGDIPALASIERATLEFDRGDEFEWLLAHRDGYLYRQNGRPIGFSFVGPTGSGPIAALDPAQQVPILAHLEARASELGLELLSLEVPMINEVAMRHLLDRGFRIDPFLTLFMSSRPFGRFDRYIGFSPPFIL